MYEPMKAHHYCPVCGMSNRWVFGLMRHWVEGVKYVHVRFRTYEPEHKKFWQMSSILRDGKAQVAVSVD
jgi:hypothetical protein